MPSLSLVEPVVSRALTILDREAIAVGVQRGLSMRVIAAGIGRAPSTVSRELAANMRVPYRARGSGMGRPCTAAPQYSPHLAQRRADANLARPKVARLAGNQRLRVEVQARLEAEHSPAQISARLRVDFPDDPEMWVSHETIYQSLYVQGRGALRRDLTVRLRTGRALRRPRRRPAERRGRIPGMVNISERPAEAADRAGALGR